jgi:hypothetical protein
MICLAEESKRKSWACFSLTTGRVVTPNLKSASLGTTHRELMLGTDEAFGWEHDWRLKLRRILIWLYVNGCGSASRVMQ